VALTLKRLLTDAGAKAILTREKDVEIKNKDIVNAANSNNADMFVAIHFNSYTSPRISGCETHYFTPLSKKFANIMQKNVSSTIKIRNRGVKRNTYYVIHHAKMPSVLVEAGYLTNPGEERKILTLQFRRLIAMGICRGIIEYAKMSPTRQGSR
jgi:N-acetylmuramoyl-L-alanine amidase